MFKDPKFLIPQSTIRIPQSCSRQIALQINRFLFVKMTSFIPNHGDARTPIKIVFVVFAPMVDQKIFFLVDQL